MPIWTQYTSRVTRKSPNSLFYWLLSCSRVVTQETCLKVRKLPTYVPGCTKAQYPQSIFVWTQWEGSVENFLFGCVFFYGSSPECERSGLRVVYVFWWLRALSVLPCAFGRCIQLRTFSSSLIFWTFPSSSRRIAAACSSAESSCNKLK